MKYCLRHLPVTLAVVAVILVIPAWLGATPPGKPAEADTGEVGRENALRRLPPVPSIKKQPKDTVRRLFPKPKAQQPALTAAKARFDDLESGSPICSLDSVVPPAAVQSPAAGQPTLADEPTPADPPLRPTPLEMDIQPAVLSRREVNTQNTDRSNVLVNPLSGQYDFTEPMSAICENGDDSSEIHPRELGRATLPPPLIARVEEILAEATRLADRGALFAARREFLSALRMTTRALDTSLGRPYHSRALANGLRALEEADDFSLDTNDSVENDLRLANYIKGHRTPVLKHDDPQAMTPLMALQSYFEYAREQLTVAGGGSPLAAQALYSMGRAEMLLDTAQQNGTPGAPKSLAFFHAALTIDPNNAPAGNEMGVMLARRGRLTDAAQLLERSVASAATPEALENLATVYERLGDARSQSIRHHALLAATQTYGAPHIGPQPIMWLEPHTFSGNGQESFVSEPSVTDVRMANVGNTTGSQPNRSPSGPTAEQSTRRQIQPVARHAPLRGEENARERFWW